MVNSGEGVFALAELKELDVSSAATQGGNNRVFM